MSERAQQIVVLLIRYDPVDEHTEIEMGARKDRASNWAWSEIVGEDITVIAESAVTYYVEDTPGAE